MTDVRIQPEFQGGPGYTAPTVLIDGEHLRDYLDMAIREWRAKRSGATDPATRELARYYIDAFQSVRTSVFGEVVSATRWLETHGLPNYGAEGCRCGSHATPAPDCPLHYFLVVVERMEDCIHALLDPRLRDLPENIESARILVGLDP